MWLALDPGPERASWHEREAPPSRWSRTPPSSHVQVTGDQAPFLVSVRGTETSESWVSGTLCEPSGDLFVWREKWRKKERGEGMSLSC